MPCPLLTMEVTLAAKGTFQVLKETWNQLGEERERVRAGSVSVPRLMAAILGYRIKPKRGQTI